MKFYVNDYPFEIYAKEKATQINQKDIVLGAASADQVMHYYDLVQNGKVKGKTAFVFVVSNYKKVVSEVKESFKIIEAAGGIASKDGNLLLIHRLGKWDLPKGKMEKGESPEETAVREVEEECGVKVTLGDKIGESWHTYIHKKKNVLNCTHWYKMDCVEDSALKPQEEEGIDKVVWMSKEEAEKEIVNDSYASIVDIFLKYKSAL